MTLAAQEVEIVERLQSLLAFLMSRLFPVGIGSGGELSRQHPVGNRDGHLFMPAERRVNMVDENIISDEAICRAGLEQVMSIQKRQTVFIDNESLPTGIAMPSSGHSSSPTVRTVS